MYSPVQLANQLKSFYQYVFQTMDISKMSSGDASFTVPFKLVAERNDFIHALVAYFNVSFTKCHKLMGFSTGLSFTFCHKSIVV
jgi:protein arginine N-methyltransferase 1